MSEKHLKLLSSMWISLYQMFIRGQLQQHFTRSFYKCRSQMHKRHWWIDCLFALLGSLCIKAVNKHVGDIDFRSLITNLSCLSIFVVGHIIIVLLPKSISSFFSVIVFTLVKGALPILTTIANFGTIQFVISQYYDYFQSLRFYCLNE